jgi:hypothetical protein
MGNAVEELLEARELYETKRRQPKPPILKDLNAAGRNPPQIACKL